MGAELRVNLLSAVDLTKCAIRHFRRHGGGRIVNMASRAGQRGHASDAMAYGASKAALITLTKSVAQSHGAEGITAVALAPGRVRTDMAEAFVAQHGEAAQDFAMQWLWTNSNDRPNMGIGLHLSEAKGPVLDRLRATRFLRDLGGRVFLSQLDAWSGLTARNSGPGYSG